MKIHNAFRVGLVGTLGVGLGFLILTSVVALSTILTYIGAALFIALGIEPIVAFLERRKLPRWAALLIVLIVLLGLLALLIWAIVPIIVDQSTQLVKDVTKFVSNGTANQWYSGLKHQFPGHRLRQRAATGVDVCPEERRRHHRRPSCRRGSGSSAESSA